METRCHRPREGRAMRKFIERKPLAPVAVGSWRRRQRSTWKRYRVSARHSKTEAHIGGSYRTQMQPAGQHLPWNPGPPGSKRRNCGNRPSPRWVFQKGTGRVDIFRWAAKREWAMIHDDAQLMLERGIGTCRCGHVTSLQLGVMLVTPLDTLPVRAEAWWALSQRALDHPSQQIHPAREASP